MRRPVVTIRASTIMISWAGTLHGDTLLLASNELPPSQPQHVNFTAD